MSPHNLLCWKIAVFYPAPAYFFNERRRWV